MATAHDPEVRQPIPLLAQAVVDPSMHDGDVVSALIAAFDAALVNQKRVATEVAALRVLAKALPIYGNVRHDTQLSLIPETDDATCEYALRLWCSANGIALEVHDYIHDVKRWHVLRANLDGVDFISVQKSWPLATEPRLVRDADAMWSPAHGSAQ